MLLRLLKSNPVFAFLKSKHSEQASPHFSFSGKFLNWEDAKGKCDGYDDQTNLARVLEVQRDAVQKGRGFEQDGTLVSGPVYSWPSIALMLKSALDRGFLHVVDFGGSLGSKYFQWSKLFAPVKDLTWTVVEQGNYVDAGKEFQNNHLRFSGDLNGTLSVVDDGVFLASGSLQYTSNPSEILETIKKSRFDFLVFDRIPVVEVSSPVLTIQTNGSGLGGTSYPMWIFPPSFLKESLEVNFYILDDLPSTQDGVHSFEGLRLSFRTFVFCRIQKP